MPLFEASASLSLFTRQKHSFWDEMCLFMRGKCLFVSLSSLFERHNCLFVRHTCLFVRHKRVFVRIFQLRTYLSRNSNLRPSEAHFIKKTALRGTAATCDSLAILYFPPHLLTCYHSILNWNQRTKSNWLDWQNKYFAILEGKHITRGLSPTKRGNFAVRLLRKQFFVIFDGLNPNGCNKTFDSLINSLILTQDTTIFCQNGKTF